MKLQELTVTGMTCASCSARIEKVVGRVPGVSHASVNLATERLSVEFDEALASTEAIRKAVEGAGYGIAERQAGRRVVFPVDGMTCASCSARIEKVVGRIAGVESVAVNLATEKADVTYDPARVRLSEIKRAITAAGYTPREVDAADTVDQDAERKERAIRALRRPRPARLPCSTSRWATCCRAPGCPSPPSSTRWRTPSCSPWSSSPW